MTKLPDPSPDFLALLGSPPKLKSQAPPKPWFVGQWAARDHMGSCLPALQWLATAEEHILNRTEKWQEFLEAHAVLSRVHLLDTLRQPPLVFYNFASDTHGFLFKEDNNGTVWTVSHFRLAEPDMYGLWEVQGSKITCLNRDFTSELAGG